MLIHSNFNYKYLPLFIAFIMFAFNLFIPMTIVFAEEDNPLRCTYGVYDADAHGIVESDLDYYDTMNFNGFCEGVYQYYVDNYPNIDFISFDDFKHYVSSTINLQFWDALVFNAYYLNVYCDDDTIVIFAQHQPLDIFPPVVSWYPTESGRNVTLGIEQDTAYFIYDTGKLFMYEPPVSFWISNADTFHESAYMGFLDNFSSENPNFSTNEYVINSINSAESFGYAFVLHVSDIANLTFSFSAPWNWGYVTNYQNSFGVFSEVYGVTGETSIDLTFDYDPVLTTFPVWTPTENFFVGSYKLEYLSGNTPYVSVENPKIYGNIAPHFRINYEFSPIIASNYAEVPIATPTPTAIPPITLYPTPTPYVVETMEGVGQMFTLFTRKYSFNINGVDIGIRPFYLVLACFIVGSIFTMVQGGNKS